MHTLHWKVAGVAFGDGFGDGRDGQERDKYLAVCWKESTLAKLLEQNSSFFERNDKKNNQKHVL